MVPSVIDRHIEITPGIVGGKPRVVGRRITVQNIVIWHEHLGQTADEISAAHDLTLADIYAALTYYFDHREIVDASIRADEAFASSLREQTASVLQAKLRSMSQ